MARLILVVFFFGFVALAQPIVISPRGVIVKPKLDFEVQVWVDKDPSGEVVPVYRIGERIRLGVYVAEASHVYLYSIKSTGKIQQILPNQFDADGRNNYMQAGQTKLFAPIGATYELTVDGPIGLDKVIVLASQDPLDTDQLAQFRDDAYLARSSFGEFEFANSLGAIVEAIPLGNWATDTVLFGVGKALASPGFGTFQLNTQPAGARVYVDGRFAGFTPTTYVSSVGRHDIYFDLDGYETFATRVNLRGGHIYPVRVRLTPDIHGVGTLLLEANTVGAQVFVDGRPAGQISSRLEKLAFRRLSIGEHEVTVIAPGFTTEVEYFLISGGNTTEVRIEQQLLN
jgi:hypothetical protein